MTLAEVMVRVGVDASRVAAGIGVAESTLERFGTRLFYMGARITAGVSAPAAAAAFAVTKMGLDFDKAMSESTAIMDDMSSTMRLKMEDVAKSVTSFSKFSAAEGAEAFYDLASAGFTAEQSMQGLPIVTKFAQASLIDLATAGEYLTRIQISLGDHTDNTAERMADMTRISDVLVKVNNLALGTVEDFAQALVRPAGLMKEFNVSLETGTAVLAAYASRGIHAANAGQQLYMMMRDLARFATRNAEAFKENNIAVFDSAGNMRNLADIIQDFEKRLAGASDAQSAMLFQMLGMTDRSRHATQALVGFSDAIRNYETQLKGAAGTTETVAQKQMQALTNILLQIKNQFGVLLIDIFTQFRFIIEDYVIPGLRAVLDVGKDFVEWLKGVGKEGKLAIAGLMGFAIVVGPLTTFIGSWAIFVSLMAKPIAPAVAGIGMAATNMGTAMGAAATQTGFLTRAATGLLGVASKLTFWGSIAAAIYLVVNAAKDLAGGWSQLWDIVQMSMPQFLLVQTYWEGLKAVWEKISTPLSNLKSLIDEVNRGALLIMKDYALSIADAFGDWSGVTESTGSQLDLLNAVLRDTIDLMISLVPGLGPIIAGLTWIGEKALDAAKDLKKYNDEQERISRKRTTDIHLPYSFDMGPAPIIGPGGMIESLRPDVPTGAGTIQGPGRAGIPDLPSGFGGEGAGGDKPPSFIGRLKDELKELAMYMEAAAKEGVPLSMIAEEFGTRLDNAVDKAGLLKIAVADSVTSMNAKVKEFEFDKIVAEQLKSVTKGLDQMMGDIGGKMPDVVNQWGEAFTKIIELQERLSDATKTQSDLRITLIERQREAEIRAAENMIGATRAQKDEQIRLIKDYYDHETRLAARTQDTIVERMRASGVFVEQEYRKMAGDSRDTWEQMKTHNETATDAMKFRIEDLKAAWDRWYDSANKPNPFIKFFGDALSGLDELSKAFDQLASVAGEGAFSGFVAGVAETITTLNLAVKAGNEVAEAFDGIKKALKAANDGVEGWGADLAQNLVGLATGIVSGVGAIAQATSSGNQLQNVVGGATTGASLGAGVASGAAALAGATAKGMAVAGVWGAAAGAIVGIFIGVFRGGATRNLMEKVGEEWGAAISEGTAKAIQKTARELNVGDVEASLIHMKDIISEMGGVNVGNLDNLTSKLRDVFVMMEKGSLTAAQATTILEENFGAIADAVVKTGEVASKEFLDIIRLTQEWGLNVKAVVDFVIAQTSRFGTAMESIVKGSTFQFAGMADKIKTAKEELAKLIEEGAEMEKIEVATKKVNDLLADQAKAAADAGDDMERLSLIIVSGFRSSIASGANLITALNSVAPAIDALILAYQNLGISSDNAAIQQLIAIREMQLAVPELVNGIAALAEGMLSLSMIGGLNVETFNAMQQQGFAMYQSLQAEAERLGVDQSVAIQMMIPFLKAVLSANKEYGFSIDENIQKLIDQAREMGLLADEQLEINDILIQGLGAIIKALGGELPAAFQQAADAGAAAFDAVADAAQASADAAADAFANIHIPDVVVPVYYEAQNSPPTYDAAAYEPPMFAAGGIVNRATFGVMGESGPEAIIPLSQIDHYLHNGQRENGDMIVVMDGRKVGKAVLKRTPNILRNKGVRS